ncbi:MAG: cyclic nucleotide-binding domain-containing protein [Verrucomicrobia bacterium]|jgi:CRP/FNR family cyclic AMP-dependent transcriptional regulator|nr:cyclic nucleotide-binding domain-containing protein [Verrucomicrobiota bacterium]
MEKSSLNPFLPLTAEDPRLNRFAVFSGLGPEEISTLIRLTDTISFQKGSKIITSGEEGHCLYLILQGSALVSAAAPDQAVHFAKLGVGDFLGEISLVDDGPRSADVLATEDCTLMRMTRTTLGVLAGLQPSAAVSILSAIGSELVKRLRATNQKYLDLLHRSAPEE